MLMVALAAISCTESYSLKQLQNAEDIMDSAPDSALTILSRLDTTELNSDKERAIYCLLETRAKNKMYIDQTDDTKIKFSIRYFDSHNDYDKAFWSHFYRSVINLETKNYITAITEADIALKLAMKTQNSYHCAKTEENIADIYSAVFNYPEAIVHRKRAYNLYARAGYNTNSLYSLIDLAREYSTNQQPELAIKVLEFAETKCDANDSTLIGFLNDTYLMPLLQTGDYNQAIEKYKKALIYWPEVTSTMQEHGLLAEIYLKAGHTDTAYMFVEKSYKYDAPEIKHANLHYTKYLIYRQEGKTGLALDELEKTHLNQNDAVRETLKNNVAIAERNFRAEESDTERLRAGNYLLALVLIASIAVSIIVVFALISHWRTKKKKLEAEIMMSEVQNLSAELSQKNKELKDLDSKLTESIKQTEKLKSKIDSKTTINRKQTKLIGKLFESQYETLNTLSASYFDFASTPATRHMIIKEVEKEVNHLKSKNSLQNIVSIVNACRDDIVDKLKVQMPRLKDTDITFFALILAGFSPRSICLLTDITLGNYYNKWTRLRQRIAISDAQNKDLFLNALRRER